MSLTFYSNYLNNIAVSPNQKWRDEQRAFIDGAYDNTTVARDDVYEENYPFDFKFVNNPKCWLGTVLDVTTGMVKNSDDYRSLYFKDIDHEAGRGRYFKWDNSYWIVYETTTHELETISTCNIRRCNNWLKWVTDKGELIQYPCVIEGELTSANAQVAKTISQANSHINVIVQGNADTLKIKKNDRFIFNGISYRFYAINNYMQVDYVDDNAPMLFMDFYLDMEIDEDNLKENIASDTRNQFSLVSNITSISNDKNYMGTINPIVYRDNNVIDNVRMEFTSTNPEVVTVDDNGEFQLMSYGQALIIVQIKGNPMSAITIPVSVVDQPNVTYNLIISPIITTIKQGRSVILSAQVVDNYGNTVDSEVYLTINGGDGNNNYTLTNLDNNTWKLTNNLLSNTPIELTFINTEHNLQRFMTIELNAMF